MNVLISILIGLGITTLATILGIGIGLLIDNLPMAKQIEQKVMLEKLKEMSLNNETTD